MTHQRSGSRVAARPQIHTREALPGVNRTKEGTLLMCPFCTPSHPIVPNEPTPCGTMLKVTAVQTIIPARVARREGLICLKCKQAGSGDMVQYMNGFIHLDDCAPGTQLLRMAPNYTRWAQMVYKLPKALRAQVEKVTGGTHEVLEIDSEGKETGKVVGYFFLKGKSNATSRPAPEPAAR